MFHDDATDDASAVLCFEVAVPRRFLGETAGGAAAFDGTLDEAAEADGWDDG